MATHARLPQRADDAAAGKAAGEERASAEARDGGAGEGEGKGAEGERSGVRERGGMVCDAQGVGEKESTTEQIC